MPGNAPCSACDGEAAHAVVLAAMPLSIPMFCNHNVITVVVPTKQATRHSWCECLLLCGPLLQQRGGSVCAVPCGAEGSLQREWFQRDPRIEFPPPSPEVADRCLTRIVNVAVATCSKGRTSLARFALDGRC